MENCIPKDDYRTKVDEIVSALNNIKKPITPEELEYIEEAKEAPNNELFFSKLNKIWPSKKKGRKIFQELKKYCSSDKDKPRQGDMFSSEVDNEPQKPLNAGSKKRWPSGKGQESEAVALINKNFPGLDSIVVKDITWYIEKGYSLRSLCKRMKDLQMGTPNDNKQKWLYEKYCSLPVDEIINCLKGHFTD